MKNIFKIILILCLGVFVATGCSDDSGGGNGSGDNTENNGGGNTDLDDTAVYDTPVFSKVINIEGLTYGETEDGKRYVWGNVGELVGAGNKDKALTPVAVDFKIIKTKESNTYYVITDAGLYAWGDNYYGQVGNGTTDDVSTPYKVDGIDGNVQEVIVNDSSSYITVFVRTDTGLYAWGYNHSGQVGNGDTGNDRIPNKVIDENIEKVIFNNNGKDVTVYAVTDTGLLYAWGYNFDGQVGNGVSSGFDGVNVPYKVEGIDGNIREVITYNNTVFVWTDTNLYAWGYNHYGQVGNGTTDDVNVPYKVEGIGGNIQEGIKAGSTVYVRTDTGLYAWGNNEYGQVGNGKTDNVVTPYKVDGINGNIQEVITAGYTVYVRTDTGLYAWGDNEYGQVGNGKTDNVTDPYKVINGNIQEVITAGYTVFVRTDTGLYTWGYNKDGQVGNGKTDNVADPYKVIDGNIKEVIFNNSSDIFTVYVITDTGLYAWGYNKDGQVGSGDDAIVVITPKKIINESIKELKFYQYTSTTTVYAITDTGLLYAWGDNDYGQVGNGDDIGWSVTAPYEVKGIDGKIQEVIFNNDSGGGDITVYAVTDTGLLYAWGNNYDGQIGGGYNIGWSVLTPYEVKGIDGKIQEIIAACHTVFVRTDAGLYAWGNNHYGQVGNGTTSEVDTPYKVKVKK